MTFKQIPSADELRRLYWDEELSTCDLGRHFGTYQSTALQWMRKYDIPRRNRVQAVIKARSKYMKVPFTSGLQDKAYLLGLTFADLSRRRHGYQVRVMVHTTHPAFSNLFKTLFGKFTHVYERPIFNRWKGKYEWELEALLHPSFDFLLSPKHVPEWVLDNDNVFLHFLAGYADGEGIISITRNSARCIAFVFCIASEDISILCSIRDKLRSMGFHPSLWKLRKAGEFNTFNGKISCYRKDHWMLRLKRRKEVIKLLGMLPLKHQEKVRKRQMMFELQDKVYIADVEKAVQRFRDGIENEVRQYMHAAKKACRRKLKLVRPS